MIVYIQCATRLYCWVGNGLWVMNKIGSPNKHRGELQAQKPHKWEHHSYIPNFSTFCDHCGTVLHGLYQQGLKCSGTECTTIPLLNGVKRI